jgi:ABC-type polysaccharide/polyol phosphate transport system ATPase subunit
VVPANIQIVNVSRAFTIRHNTTHSLKSRVIGMFNERYREEKETLWALRDVSLDILPGEAFGLIGRNGSGKSTLLKIIAGIYPPTQGEVHLPDSIRIGTMIELGVGFHPDLTGKENVFLGASIHGLTRKEIKDIYDDIVEFSELRNFMDTPIKNYSSGMHARLGFALAVNLNPDMLIIDEVLAVGDESFQGKCVRQIEKFRADGKTILFVSHSPEAVMRVCDRACVLDYGSRVYLGTARAAIEYYRETLSR